MTTPKYRRWWPLGSVLRPLSRRRGHCGFLRWPSVGRCRCTSASGGPRRRGVTLVATRSTGRTYRLVVSLLVCAAHCAHRKVTPFLCVTRQILNCEPSWHWRVNTTLSRNSAGVDMYYDFATQLFGREITKADKAEQFLGKTAMLVRCWGTKVPRDGEASRREH